MINIIIPVHNRKKFTQKCLLSLYKQTYRDFKIIVVDDGSTDGTYEMLQDKFPEVDVVKGDGNLWWTGAINKGIKEAQKYEYDFILTLNDDLELPEAYLENMIYIAKHNPDSLIGSISLDYNDHNIIDYAGIKINWRKSYKKKMYNKNIALSELPELFQTDSLTGRGTLIPKNVFDSIGLFDENKFPHYAADEDFSLRAKKKGFKLLLSKNVYLFSHISLTGYHSSNYKNIIQYYKNLFSRKSSNNIIYSNRLLIRHCPKKYLLSNFLYSNTKRLIYPFAKKIGKI